MELTTRIEALFQAAEHGDLSQVQQILSSHPALANEENANGLTPLGYAAHFGHRDIAAVLLDAGADVNAMSHSKLSFIPSNTALHAVLAGARSEEVVQLLLDRGASVHLIDSNGHAPLHVAAFHDGNTGLIRKLLEHGADVNARADGGDTPLAIALRQGNAAVAAYLREHGAKE